MLIKNIDMELLKKVQVCFGKTNNTFNNLLKKKFQNKVTAIRTFLIVGRAALSNMHWIGYWEAVRAQWSC